MRRRGALHRSVRFWRLKQQCYEAFLLFRAQADNAVFLKVTQSFFVGGLDHKVAHAAALQIRRAITMSSARGAIRASMRFVRASVRFGRAVMLLQGSP